MTNIAQHIQELQASLPKGVTLVAVSKFHPAEALQEAYDAGQRVFGESRAQELVAKAKVLPKDIEWHFIGPLQSNKVKDIAPFAGTSLIAMGVSFMVTRYITSEWLLMIGKILIAASVYLAILWVSRSRIQQEMLQYLFKKK